MADEDDQSGGEAWGDPISPARKAELGERLQAWESESGQSGPFARMKLTGADVYWLIGVKYRDSFDARYTNLNGVDLSDAQLVRADLVPADLEDAILSRAHMEEAIFGSQFLEPWDKQSPPPPQLLGLGPVSAARLDHATLVGAHLLGAQLVGVHLNGADLRVAHLEMANLQGAHLEGASLNYANLKGADLSSAYLDGDTNLSGAFLGDAPPSLFTRPDRRARRQGRYATHLADLHWNGADLTRIDWSTLRKLGDEYWPGRWGHGLDSAKLAARANVQLANRLRDAGMNHDADHFAYRAQLRQRRVHLLSGRIMSWLFSWLLYIIAGYGYRPVRTLLWYLVVMFAFAFAYHSVGSSIGVPLSPLGSLVFSVMSFHGRGFFPGGSPGHSLTLDDPLTVMAAAEAVIGLFIEISFIATFTQRYFGK